jgi:putative membrane protein
MQYKMEILISLIINGLAVFVAAQILPGVKIDNFLTAIITAIILGVVNTFIKPVLFILTLPATILTLGLFTFFINALMILLVDAFVSGFSVENFWWALLFSLVLSMVSSILRLMSK